MLAKDASNALGKITSAFYGHPSEKIQLIGITGTNGKTTTASLLYQLFKRLGHKVGLISTIEYRIGEEVRPSTHTTPNALILNALLAEMLTKGCAYCFMEVSSHAIHQERISGVKFKGGVFTNITHDHLDYHKSFKEYIKVKKTFFDNLPSTSFALSNLDDKNGKVMLQNTKAEKLTYGIQSLANYRLKILENNLMGLVLKIDNLELHTKLIGDYNAYNLLAVYAVALELGVAQETALMGLSQLEAAEGRFDVVFNSAKKLRGVVDYAHTPDALEKILNSIRKSKSSESSVITVVGCGGDRDKTKRPKMARIALDLSERVVLTSDNPRTEDPNAILLDMQAGVASEDRGKVLVISNRKEAIKTACMLAKEGDIVLVAGKGHEKYQEINGVKHPFDDKQVLEEVFAQM